MKVTATFPVKEGGAGRSRASCATRPATTPVETTPVRDAGRKAIVLDFETRSQAKLPQVGGRNYALDVTTEVVCLVARLPDGCFVEWHPGQPEPSEILDLVQQGTPLAAHNAFSFDRFIWVRLGWPEPSQ